MPNDGFGDVFLVIDNYRALAEENEVLIEQVNLVINQGPLFGIHVVATADRDPSCGRRFVAVSDPGSSCAWLRSKTPSWCARGSQRMFRSSRAAVWSRSTTFGSTAIRNRDCTRWSRGLR